ISSSYNGSPPDNATRFCRWLAGSLPAGALQGVRYCVFGCGNREWASTYQSVPRLLDRRLEECGAARLVDRGEADAGRDFDGDFQAWYRGLWTELGQRLGIALEKPSEVARRERYQVEVLSDPHPNPFVPSFQAGPMTVIENRELQTGGERSTRHLELALPEGVSYTTGDHLGVIPRNGPAAVRRVAAHFGLTPETRLRLSKRDNEKTVLPLDQVVSVGSLLGDYLELQEVATRRHLEILAGYTECPRTRAQLLALAGADEAAYQQQVLNKHKSLLDVLEEHPACELPLHVYLELLSPLKPRYYSISSSNLLYGRLCSLTVGVVEGPARSGRGRFEGTCSNHLARQKKGSTIYGFVRQANAAFRLPRSPATPVIMIGPGTGLAPFRGFLQERQVLQDQGKRLGRAMLFFGCRHPEQDYLYQNELENYARQGIVELQLAFSRQDPQRKVYVQDKLREIQDDLWEMLEMGATVYICGDGAHMAPAVRQTFTDLYASRTDHDAEQARHWLDELMAQGRYVLDVWA
ncbi:MAG: flavodoxin domain-containing protein, partial [Candidatus Eremiobacterota bacterium]